MPCGSLPGGRSIVATSPSSEMCAIWSEPHRLTHTPSACAAITACGLDSGSSSTSSWIGASSAIRPIRPASSSVNQSASWVAAMPTGPESRVGTSRIVSSPRTSIRPIACA